MAKLFGMKHEIHLEIKEGSDLAAIQYLLNTLRNNPLVVDGYIEDILTPAEQRKRDREYKKKIKDIQI
jgi:hypothetical protein